MSANDKAALLLLARLDSRRLPRKGLMDLHGRPVLGRTIDRLRRCGEVNRIVLATSDRPVDDELEAFADAEGIECFRGDAHDVAGRCLAAAQALQLDWFIRICGDSPFVPPEAVDRVALSFQQNDCDLASNVYPRSYPVGASAEAVSRAAMERICRSTDDMAFLEHVTLYAYEHPDAFSIVGVAPESGDFGNVSIAVDTQDELERARWITGQTSAPEELSLDEIVALAAAWAKEEVGRS